MNKKNVLPDMFDVFHIEYTSGCKSLAYAPNFTVQIGDEVITTVGRGTVKAVVKYCTPDDEWFKLIDGIYSVDRITNKIVEVK